MDQKPDVIRERIEEQRSDLAHNIRALETRVKLATDWPLRFQQKPLKMLGVALAAGLAFGWLTRPPARRDLRDCRCYCD